MAAWLIVVGIAAVLGFSGFLYLVLDPAFQSVFGMADELVVHEEAQAGLDVVTSIYDKLPIIIAVFVFVVVIFKVVNESERGI